MDTSYIRILLVEDDPDDVALLSLHLSEEPHARYDLTIAQCFSDALGRARDGDFDVILLDLGLPDSQGFETFHRLHAHVPQMPIVVLTGFDDERFATRAVREGAQDYLVKGKESGGSLMRTIRYAIERKHAERSLYRLNRTHRTLSECNQAMIHAENESDFLHKICRIIVEVGGYRLVWVGFSEPDERGMMRPVARGGYVEDSIEKADITWPKTEEVYSPVGLAILTGEATLVRDIRNDSAFASWREDAIERGYASCIALPLIDEGRVFGALNICAVQPDAFDEDEVKLLNDLAGDLAYGIMSIRAREKCSQAGEALRVSEEKMRVIIESSPIGIRINQNDRCVYVNPALVRMFGYERAEEIIGLPVESLYAPEDRQRIRQRMKDRMEGKLVSHSYEAKGVGKNGRIFDVAVWVTQIDYHGEPAILAFIIDVSMEKALQAQLFRAQKMEAIGTLAGGIAHDFNNILGIIMGYTEIALFNMDKENPLYDHFEQVRKASQRAVDLVKQILAFSRRGEQDRKPLHVSPIIKETLKLLRAALPSTIEIRQSIKISQGEDTILADPTRLHQIIMNLCTNAAHAMREGGGILSVSLSMAKIDSDEIAGPMDLQQGHYVRLTISDTGHGMDCSIMERIFEPYFSTKEIGEGTGLGLSVVHGIVRSHGGAITVSSKPGRGASFDVYFPRLVKEISPDDEVASILPIGRETVLLVDDEEGLVNAGRQMLEYLGYNVVVETSSVNALEAFRKRPESFDLVITDLTMPKMTGIELTGKLLDIKPDIPIIMCTGFSELVTPEKAKVLGIRELVMKPILLYDIAKAIRRALSPDSVGNDEFVIQ